MVHTIAYTNIKYVKYNFIYKNVCRLIISLKTFVIILCNVNRDIVERISVYITATFQTNVGRLPKLF